MLDKPPAITVDGQRGLGKNTAGGGQQAELGESARTTEGQETACVHGRGLVCFAFAPSITRQEPDV